MLDNGGYGNSIRHSTGQNRRLSIFCVGNAPCVNKPLNKNRSKAAGLLGAAAVTTCAFVLPAAANADDAAIKQAVLTALPPIQKDQRKLTTLSDKPTRANLNRGIKLIGQVDKDLVNLAAAVKGQQASTPTGTAGQQDALTTVALVLRSNHQIQLEFESLKSGHKRSAKHHLKLALSDLKKAAVPGNKADKELGLPAHTLGT
jgi:hypothetical protein